MKTRILNPTQLIRYCCIAALVLSFAACSKDQVKPRDIVIEPPPAPQADFIFSTNNSTVPATVHFYNCSHNAIKYEWDFGDGTRSDQIHPVKVYTYKGSYTIRLTAIGSLESSTISRPITVY